MYRPGSSDAPPRARRLLVLRGIGFGVAVVAGAVALWLIVSSDSSKQVKIGVLVGLWGLLVGAFSVFGTRTPVREVPVAIPVPAPAASGSQEIDLRKVGEIERAAVAAARREFQAELTAQLEQHFAAQLATVREHMQRVVHDEVQVGVAHEVSGLRDEVAALRNELLEKVGGQLRLERIETTRLIGSDLEALQHELRQLRQIGSIEVDEPHRSEQIRVERVSAPVQSPPRPVQLPVVVEAQPAPEPPVAVAVEPEPEAAVEPEPAVEPVAVEREPEPVAVAPEPEPEPEPEREHRAATDPFASLPRLTPFAYDADPITEPEPVEDASNGGRHGVHRHAPAEPVEEPAGRGRRHRAADDDGNDVLARILARERQ